MVCSEVDLVAWRDFTKDLRVLLLDEDAASAAQTKLMLEAMDYIVFSYCDETEALKAISTKAEGFHVAIVEVTGADSHGSFRFLELAKGLPTIAISDVHCLSTMMKCIALGAAEFLQKPLSEEKLRNIWQHVVHKAFNAGGNCLSKSLQPIKESVASMLQIQSDTSELGIELPTEIETNDKFPGPSTPQLGKGQEPQNSFKDKDHSNDGNYSNSKSVDNTTCNLPDVVNSSKEVSVSNRTLEGAEEEVTSDNTSKTDECSSVKDSCRPSLDMHKGDNVESRAEDQKKKKSFHCGNKSSKRKMKVDWTPDLHRKFVKAVEELGIDQAIPSKILELMKVEGLTRHNIASHLQKYRMNRRHVLPKDGHKRWHQHRDSFPGGYMQKPVIPQFHSSRGLRPSQQVYPFWGHPSYCNTGATQMWSPAGFPTWHQPQGSWLWKTHPGVHAEAWGCPAVPPYNQFAIPSQNAIMNNALDSNGGRNKVSKESYDFNLAEEVIDEVVKEAMNKPWLPLPLGLKPPSVDSVLNELQRQGIRRIPPSIHRC